MTYTTHRIGGLLAAMGGYTWLHANELLPDSDVHMLLQLAVIVPCASWASTLPDLDHHWDSIRDQTPVNWVIHKVLHLLGAKHRSWQTHSIVFVPIFCYLLFLLADYSVTLSMFSFMDIVLLRLLATGFSLGLASHLFLDLLTPQGLAVVPYRSKRGFSVLRIRLFRSSRFATGSSWEAVVQRVLWLCCFLLCAYWLFLWCGSIGLI